jgi:hypothetical protein
MKDCSIPLSINRVYESLYGALNGRNHEAYVMKRAWMNGDPTHGGFHLGSALRRE